MTKKWFAITPIRTVASAAVLMAAMVAAPVARAQTATFTDGTQPVVVVSVASISKLTADVNHVTTLAGQPQFGGIFAMMTGMYAQGIDTSRPIGVLVPLAGGMPQPIVVLPTSDIRSILKRIETQTGPVDELDDGTLVLTVNRNTVFIKQNGNNAIAAPSKDVLGLVPADPSAFFAGMGDDYNVAVKLQVQQIPMELRNVAIDSMRQGFEQAMANQPDNEASREMAESSIEQLEQLIRDADQLFFGININQEGRHIALDASFTAVPGSKLAAMYGGQQAIPSRFASVINESAAAYLHSATSISPEAITQAKSSLGNATTMIRGAIEAEGNMPPQQIEEIEQYMGRFFAIITESIEEGKADMGLMVNAGTDKFNAVLGFFIADGEDFAALAKDLATKVPDVDDAPRFSFDVGKHGDVTMHLIEADIPEYEHELRSMFGDTLKVHIGTAPKAIYLAIGRDSEGVLNQFIDAGNSSDNGNRPLGQFKMKLMPFLELARSVDPRVAEKLEPIIASLNASSDKGTITMVTDSIDNGSNVSIKVGESLIEAIGASMKPQQPGQF
ncbi:hypothetical protein [Rhodopirellula sp. MGV]|uniref:hypothetical protein n=1 Tax=Rhodopirellula sp. MGV TaxID=2023130 RepID=UPI000B978536|nr:hypothetical protein [Rhodopirellula sp. MGV]OYP36690.1 hypothetical protein CGZ80_07650 [Rhodopirellula sp. MGV]